MEIKHKKLTRLKKQQIIRTGKVRYETGTVQTGLRIYEKDEKEEEKGKMTSIFSSIQ